jgi:hypothetical protein
MRRMARSVSRKWLGRSGLVMRSLVDIRLVERVLSLTSCLSVSSSPGYQIIKSKKTRNGLLTDGIDATGLKRDAKFSRR